VVEVDGFHLVAQVGAVVVCRPSIALGGVAVQLHPNESPYGRLYPTADGEKLHGKSVFRCEKLPLPQTPKCCYHPAFHSANRDVPLRAQGGTTACIRRQPRTWAFVMLACAVAIPLLAMSGASWSEILRSFRIFTVRQF